MFNARVTASVDAEIADLERHIAALRATHATQPALGELVGPAVEETDLQGDTDRDPHILAIAAANAANAAAEQWEDDYGWPPQGVPLAVNHDVTAALIQYARDLFAAEGEARAELRLDAIEAGDTDAEKM